MQKHKAYYNEIDPKCCAWLQALMDNGLIMAGKIDNRSIYDVSPDDLRGFTRVGFFAGIGGWDLALQLAGWPTDRPVWHGSCPCQPFSSAGKGLAQADERHLWPVFFNLIKECRPNAVFGEQVASAIGHGWLDGIQADLESENYACGAAVLGAHSVGAPHIRQRLYWVADSDGKQELSTNPIRFYAESGSSGPHSRVADSNSGRFQQRDKGIGSVSIVSQSSTIDGLADSDGTGSQPRLDTTQASRHGSSVEPDGAIIRLANSISERGCSRDSQREYADNAFPSSLVDWNRSQWIDCRDNKQRRIPIEPAFQPLANGIPARVVRLRGYGNAIVPQVAAEFIKAFLKSQTACSAVTAK